MVQNSEQLEQPSHRPILLNGAQCIGEETDLLSCPNLRINEYEGCLHTRDVTVTCHGKTSYTTVALYNI